MTLEETRQALLQLSELDRQKDSFQAFFSGSSEDARAALDTIRQQIEDASPGWRVQKMTNAWAYAWVLLPVKEEQV